MNTYVILQPSWALLLLSKRFQHYDYQKQQTLLHTANVPRVHCRRSSEKMQKCGRIHAVQLTFRPAKDPKLARSLDRHTHQQRTAVVGTLGITDRARLSGVRIAPS